MDAKSSWEKTETECVVASALLRKEVLEDVACKEKRVLAGGRSENIFG